MPPTDDLHPDGQTVVGEAGRYRRRLVSGEVDRPGECPIMERVYTPVIDRLCLGPILEGASPSIRVTSRSYRARGDWTGSDPPLDSMGASDIEHRYLVGFLDLGEHFLGHILAVFEQVDTLVPLEVVVHPAVSLCNSISRGCA